MFRLNFKIALRNIWRKKTSSLINISGLAIGLAACLLLLLYVAYEWNYDRQTQDPDHTYKVLVNSKSLNGEIERTGENTPNTLAPLFKQRYAGIVAAARVESADKKLIANGENSLKRKASFADPDLLKIYDYNFIDGDVNTAMVAPNSVIISKSTAKQLFGTADVVNRRIRYDDKIDLKITGVISDLQGNTALNFDFLMPWALNESLNSWVKEPSWVNYNYQTFVRLSPGTSVDQFNNNIKGVIHEHSSWSGSELWLYPLDKMHLYDTFVMGKSVGGKIEQVQLFMGLAIGILLIACINFMNMATAKSEKRAKEVGIKKTIGATRRSLIAQFLMESMVLTLLSTVMAIVLIELFMPFFYQLLDIHIRINYANSTIWVSLVGGLLLTGLIAGSYPALYLSSFNPIQILQQRKLKGGALSVSLRQILVVGQFSFAVVMMIATAVIYSQIQYIKSRPIGYHINNLVELKQEGELLLKLDVLRERLVKSGAVSSLYQSSGTISNLSSSFTGVEWKGASEAEKATTFAQIGTTYDFVKTTGVKLIDGRDFSRSMASDSAGLLISSSTAKLMNFKHPVGETITFQGSKSTIIGVFEDFILGSPTIKGIPLIIPFRKEWAGTITIRLNPENSTATNLLNIEKIVKELNPAYPVELTFVDQLYAEKIRNQRILGILSNVFGGLAIFISCLGLFGLAAYSAEQRTKEIGVRKVLGASVASLMQLLSLSFLKMVLIAIVIAIPVASYIMNNWLKSFEFHTSVSWVMIVMAAASTMGIALLTVSFQAYKAARTNPVDALKYE